MKRWPSIRASVLVAVILAPAIPAQQAGPLDLFVAISRGQLTGAGFARHEATVNDLSTVWWEKGSGSPLVLVHGVADQAGTWFQVAPGLAEKHRVLLIDLPGHGESAPAAGTLRMTTIVEGFEAWLEARSEAADGEPAVVVGNSMGAWVAMLAAHRRPKLVKRVIAINGGPLRPDTGGLDLLPADLEEARQLTAALRDPSSPPTPDAVLLDLVRRAETGQVQRMFEANEDLESYLLDGRLGEVDTPIDLLWGESDRYMGRDYPERLLAGLPNARLTFIPKCGHLPQAECPRRFSEKLRQVLATPPPGGDDSPSEASEAKP